MDEIFKPLLSGTTPSPPKFNVNVAWSALAPMDEKNQTPNITFANTRAETLRFGGAGVQHSACCRVWIFCPSTVVIKAGFAFCRTSRRAYLCGIKHSQYYRNSWWMSIYILISIFLKNILYFKLTCCQELLYLKVYVSVSVRSAQGLQLEDKHDCRTSLDLC